MNSTTYLFGEFLGGYSQYPEDSFSKLFRAAYALSNAPTQLVIHRDGSMMYYVYIRKFDKRYIGFAVVVNGYCFTQIKKLFSLFEDSIGRLVNKGVIINLSKNGILETSLHSLKDEEEEVMEFINLLQGEVSNIKVYKSIPRSDFAVSINLQKFFDGNNDVEQEIVSASYTYGYTIILKQKDYDTVRFRSYRSTLDQLNKEIKELQTALDRLKVENKKILQEKKQIKNVVFLFIAVIICGIGIYFLHSNLNDTQDKLELANADIQRKIGEITNKTDTILDLKVQLARINSVRKELLLDVKEIRTYYPFIVTSFDINSDIISIDYFCSWECEIPFTLKIINLSKSKMSTTDYTLTFSKGKGNYVFNTRLDSQDYYYILIIYKEQIIAGKYW
jgi:hypothetical protein